MSLIDDQSLYSRLLSRKTWLNPNARSCNNGSTDVETTLKNNTPYIKAEGPEGPEICKIGQLALLDPVLGEKIPSFNRNSWDNVSFFGDDTSAATGVLSRSCNGRLETSIPQSSSPETSQRALRSVGSREKLAQSDSSKNKTHACREASREARSEPSCFKSERSGSHSPGPSSPKLHDEGDSLFETPKASTGQLEYQLTPPTPLSAYGAQYFPPEEDSGSPIRRRRQRPGPSPVQPPRKEAKIEFRGRTEYQLTVQEGTRLRDASAQSWVSIDRSRSESTSESRDGKTFAQLKLGTKTKEGTANPYDIPNNASSPSLSTPVTGPDVLEEIFGYNILSRLKADPKRCVNDLKLPRKGRCSRPPKDGNNKIAYMRFDELRSLLSPLDVATKLEALVPLIFCGRSHLSGAKKRVAIWRLDNHSSDLLRALCHDLPRDDIGNPEDLPGSCSLVDKSRVVKEQDIIPRQPKKDVIQPFSVDLNFSYTPSTTKALRPSRYKTTISKFISWQPTIHRKVDVKTALLASITHPLRKQGDTSGYLYVYSTVGDFGARKIGVTAKDDIQERMNEWSKKCKRRINLIYPLGDEKVVVPHVYRLEKLVHAELKDYRVVENGCDCGVKQHKEWFNAKDNHIREVMRRWTEWLQKGPYEKKQGEWVLKEEFRELDEICTPYKPLEAEFALRGKTDSRKRVAATKRLTPLRRSARIAKIAAANDRNIS